MEISYLQRKLRVTQQHSRNRKYEGNVVKLLDKIKMAGADFNLNL